MTYSRMSLRPVENYRFLDDAWLADYPYEMRVLLGREDFLNKSDDSYSDAATRRRSLEWAKT